MSEQQPRPPTQKTAIASVVVGGGLMILVLVNAGVVLACNHRCHVLDILEGSMPGFAFCFLIIVMAIPAGIIIFGYIIYSMVNKKSVHPLTWVGAFAVVLALALGLASFPGIREIARRSSCAHTLRSMGLALRMYGEDWGQFPPTDGAIGLESLRSNGYLENYKLYLCPSTESYHVGRDGAEITEETADYIYWGGYSETDNLRIPLAYDKPDNHRQYGNAVFIDGKVARFFGQEWEAFQAEAKAMHERIVGPRRAEKLKKKTRDTGPGGTSNIEGSTANGE